MKTTLLTRVLTLLAALAVTCGAYGFTASDGFESETSTAVTNRANWVFEPGSSGDLEESSEILGYTATGVATPTARPSQFADDGDNYLRLSTEDGKIFFNVNGSESQSTSADVYLDTAIQFTLTDSGDRPAPTAEDKFIIWLEADAKEGTTNLCVWGGYLAEAENQYAYNLSSNVYKLANTDVEITSGSWHRITVKAVADLGLKYDNEGPCSVRGFQVYVDGYLMTAEAQAFADDTVKGFLDDDSKVIAAGDGDAGCSFIPALNQQNGLISKVGFAGEGKVDDLVVSSEPPDLFPRRVVTVTWGSDVSSVTYKLNYNAETGASSGSGTLTASGSQIAVDPGTTIRFEKSGITPTSGTYADYDFSTCTWEGEAASGNVTIDANDAAATIATTTGTGSAAATFALALKANNKIEVTLNYSNLGDAIDASAISAMKYKVGSGAWTDLASGGSTVSIGACDYGTTIEVSVTYNGETYANSNWDVSDTKLATLSGTTFTLGSKAGSVELYVAAIEPQVTINGWGYADFGDAIADVPTDGTPTTLKLTANVDDLSAQNINKQYVIIDFAGKKITSGGDVGPLFTVYNDSTLVFTNSVETTKDILNLDASEVDDAVLEVSTKGKCIIQGGYFDCNEKLISPGDKVTINGGFFDADYSADATLPSGYAMEQDPTDNLYKLVVRAPWDGEGTELLPYLIEDEEDLETLRDMINAGSYSTNYFAQTKDIALTKSWTGIGSQTNPFKGSYDGKGFAITGLRFKTEEGVKCTYKGLFNWVAGETNGVDVAEITWAVVKDLKISMAANGGTILNGFDSAAGTPVDGEYGGAAFVGQFMYARLEGLVAESGTIEGTHNVAGIAIKALPPVDVIGCTNKMSIIGNYTKMAGLITFAQDDLKRNGEMRIEDCANLGSVTGGNWLKGDGKAFSGYQGIGGLMSYVGCTNVTFKNCLSAGAISSQFTKQDQVTATDNTQPLLASFVAWLSGKTVVSKGGNVTTLVNIPALNDFPANLPKAETGFEFATVGDGTASFVVASSLDMTGATTYKVMVSNKVDVVLAAGQSVVFDESIAAAKVSTQVAGYEIAASGTTAAKTYSLAAIEYTISYADEDGTAYDTTTKWSDTATFPLALYAPTKSGYVFDGWTNATYTTAIKSLATKPAAFGDIALAAKWTVMPSDPVPVLPDNPTANDVTNAVNNIAGMSEANKAKLNNVIAGDSDKYNEFSSWTADCEVGQAAAVASTYVVESYLVSPVVAAQYYLFANEPAVKVTTFEKTDATTLSLTLELKDGDTQVQMTTAKANLAKCLRKGTNVGAIDTVLTVDEIDETVQEGADKTVTLTVKPTGLGTTGFMKFLAQ